MKKYKRKTLALVLASVITVVGAFGASNYKNSVMSLNFENDPSGSVNMTILTKINYENSLTAVKKDANTYIIMLPETNAQMSKQPTLSGSVQSVDIRTMPYTNTAKGYTKITIKTSANTVLNAKKALYIPEKVEPSSSTQTNFDNAPTQAPASNYDKNPTNSNIPQSVSEPTTNAINPPTKNALQNNINNTDKIYNNLPEETDNSVQDNNITKPVNNSANTSQDSSWEILYLALGFLLIITVTVYAFIKGSNKISEITGEQAQYDLSDEQNKPKPEQKKEQKKKIKKTIDKLDKMYKNPAPIKQLQQRTTEIEVDTINDFTAEESEEDSNIVDLDILFQEQTKNSDEDNSNDSLDEFLADFFAEENNSEISQVSNDLEKNAEIDKQNDELFNKIKNNSSIKLSKKDIENINTLINVELSDDFINEFRNIYKKATTTQPERKTLDGMVAELLSIQNISFNQNDINALDKIMNVELDKDFTTNLHTDPILTQKMEQNILNYVEKKHNTQEVIVLNVKDDLPDLSKELKKTKKIESNAKPETIFCESGYEVNTLKLDNMPDLSQEIKKHHKDEYVPSADITSNDISWETKDKNIATINVAKELPDLADVKAHPKKYEEKKTKVHVSEKDLLKNLKSVVFKPLYDGNETNEIETNQGVNQGVNDGVNTTEEFSVVEKEDLLLNITDNFLEEVAPTDDILPNNISEEPMELVTLEEKTPRRTPRKRDSQTEELLNSIRKGDKGVNKGVGVNERVNERVNKGVNEGVNKETKETPKTTIKQEKAKTKEIKQKKMHTCTVDGIDYTILAKSSFTENLGCYLATSVEEGYSILGYIGDQIFKIKQYEKVRNSNLQARMSEKLNDGTSRYVIRIGIHKFILDVSDDKMEYIMDIC